MRLLERRGADATIRGRIHGLVRHRSDGSSITTAASDPHRPEAAMLSPAARWRTALGCGRGSCPCVRRRDFVAVCPTLSIEQA